MGLFALPMKLKQFLFLVIGLEAPKKQSDKRDSIKNLRTNLVYLVLHLKLQEHFQGL
jgi:hypothetical protein